jgi:hypothetical protein
MANATEWSARVQEWRASGQSSEEFSQGKGYSAKGLRTWSSKLQRRAEPQASQQSVALARVVRRSSSEPSLGLQPVVIHVGKARVEVPCGAERATLPVVLGAHQEVAR